MRVLSPLCFVLLVLSGASQAEVRCYFGDREIPIEGVHADYTGSSSGERGKVTGRISHFGARGSGLAFCPLSLSELPVGSHLTAKTGKVAKGKT